MGGDRSVDCWEAVSSGHKEVPVTHFEKITREEIARRNYSEGTTRAYLRTLHDLAPISTSRLNGSRANRSASTLPI